MIPRFLDAFDIDFFLLAMRYTLLEQEVLDDAIFRAAPSAASASSSAAATIRDPRHRRRSGRAVQLPPAAPEILAKVAKIEAVCKRHGVPLAAAALQFPLGHPIVASIIPGAITRPGRAQPRRVPASIPADLWADLKHEKLLRADAPTPA